VASGTRIARADQAWLRDSQFDMGFIVGIAGLALLSGLVVCLEPRLFLLVLFLDLWLLGYHHVIATFTRLFADRQARREYRFLICYLPIIVLAAVLTIADTIGIWAISTIYLYWQWFHYTRQSWGIAQAYRRKAGQGVEDPAWLERAIIYLVPLWGILHRSWQQPEQFLGLDLRTLPVPGVVVDLVAAAALVAVALWLVQRARSWRAGTLAVGHTLYVMSHLVVFATGYLLIDDISFGWLVLNVWHNTQYVAFVWLFNNQRYRGGIEPGARLISSLSQPRRWAAYIFACLAVSSLAYAMILMAAPSLAAIGVPAIVIFQSINFHHYIVDAVIWKRRRLANQVAGQTGH
jgi:hypothetical protein